MHRALFVYWTHRLFRAAWVGAAVLTAYALLMRQVHHYSDFLPLGLIALHSVWIGICLGGIRGSEAEFLYSRGYSRWTLWLHAQVAAAMTVLLVCLVPALLIWLRMRSDFQERVFQTADFPFMAPREDIVPVVWLLLYLLFTPLCTLAAARKGSAAGTVWLTLGTAVSVFTLFNTPSMLTGAARIIACFAVVAIAALALTATHAIQEKQEVEL